VLVWRQGPAGSVLSVAHQPFLKVLADRTRLHQGPLTCQEMAAAFGMDVVPARVKALRSKVKRLVARGRPAERQPGRFTRTAWTVPRTVYHRLGDPAAGRHRR
jgi:hypothetical protein